jgi:hypothetical protein
MDKEENMTKIKRTTPWGKIAGDSQTVKECAGCGFVEEAGTCYVFCYPGREWEDGKCHRRTEDKHAIQRIEIETAEYARKYFKDRRAKYYANKAG